MSSIHKFIKSNFSFPKFEPARKKLVYSIFRNPERDLTGNTHFQAWI